MGSSEKLTAEKLTADKLTASTGWTSRIVPEPQQDQPLERCSSSHVHTKTLVQTLRTETWRMETWRTETLRTETAAKTQTRFNNGLNLLIRD